MNEKDSSIDRKEVKAKLTQKARELRRGALEMIYQAQAGHPGGSMGLGEIMAALYFHELRVDTANPRWENRDRLILSKGHAAPILYSALCSCGFFGSEHFQTFRQIGGILQGHPDMLKAPGVDMTSGSLGLGLSAAVGMALGAKITKKKFRVYAIIGDGECNEGQIWEAALAAAHHSLDNLCVFLDLNRFQNDGQTGDILRTEPLGGKWLSFGWHVIQINGHDFDNILDGLDEARNTRGRPTMIIAETIKGKGTSYSEENHYNPPTPEQFDSAMRELADE